MSEQDRARIYDWLCEEIGEHRADYVMARLAPAPLSDLVTKDHLETQFALHSNKIAAQIAAQFAAERDRADAQRDADRKEAAAQREADRKEAAAHRDADRKEAAVQREADRAEVKHQFRWVIGTFIGVIGLLVTAIGAAVSVAVGWPVG